MWKADEILEDEAERLQQNVEELLGKELDKALQPLLDKAGTERMTDEEIEEARANMTRLRREGGK